MACNKLSRNEKWAGEMSSVANGSLQQIVKESGNISKKLSVFTYEQRKPLSQILDQGGRMATNS